VELTIELAAVEINRLGYGAMRLTGPGIWGPPTDVPGAIAVLRRAAELGVTLFDTADSYGPDVSERLIRQALYPYDCVLIATKGGFTRQGPDRWAMCGRVAYLRTCVERSLTNLGIEQIDLWQLHRIDPLVPVEDQFGLIRDLIAEGKIRCAGLSEVTVEQLTIAQQYFDVASVQNLYNLSARDSEGVLQYCEANGIAFIPWFPIGRGELAATRGPLAALAASHNATAAQLSLSWLLHHSPVTVPIPGTTSLTHLEENLLAGAIELTPEDMSAIEAVVTPSGVTAAPPE